MRSEPYQDFNCVCVSVHDVSGMFGGGGGLESSRTAGGYKWIQSGSSSGSRRNRGAAVEADAIGEQQLKWKQAVRSS